MQSRGQALPAQDLRSLALKLFSCLLNCAMIRLTGTGFGRLCWSRCRQRDAHLLPDLLR